MSQDRAGEVLPATREDLDRILELEERCFAQPWPRKAFEDEFSRPFARLEVLRMPAGGEIVSYINYWMVQDESHLLNVAVAPDLQRRGLAHRIVVHAMERARGLGCRTMSLEVRPGNGPARGLYQKLGFVVAGRRPRYYDDGEDALIMVCEL